MEPIPMKKSILFFAITSLAAVAAHAEDVDPLSFNVGVFSEYRYRGISQTRFQPALQGGADYAFANGLYIGTWLSNIKWIKDAGRAAGVDTGSANIEWDIYGGYKGEIAKDFGYDVGVLTYYYPSNKYSNIAGAKNANTTEIYGALTFGPATVKYSHSVTTLFGFADSKNSGYLEAAATFDLGGGFSLIPHVGYQKVAKNSSYSYTDYSLTGTKEFYGVLVSLAVVGTSTKTVSGNPGGYAYYGPDVNDAKNLGKTGVVLGLKKTF
jgi:uncharacterized protein (TIGR02001 family)